MTHVARDTRGERGSVLIMAVVAMLILGVLGVSFALLSRIETEIGFNYKQQAQAEALAEAALDHARDVLRDAATEAGGFTAWLNGTKPGMSNQKLWNDTAVTPPAYAGNPAYWYRGRLDNDCGPPVVPTSIRESSSCSPTVDTNETAVVTTWAQAGSGRARVRAILSIDNVWKHVCSDHKADHGGLCNNDDNTNGNPSIQPADPNDPNGPAAWDDLPRPYMGCSRIDPTLHRGTLSEAEQLARCAANPQMYVYPYPTTNAPRWVVTGPDPAVVTGAKRCFPDPANPTVGYFGYFDCALVTPCNPTVTNCGGSGTPRRGCLPASHPNGFSTSLFVRLDPPPLGGTNTCQAKGGTGMVFTGNLPNENWGGSVGGHPIARLTYYVLRPGVADIGPPGDKTIVGTVVVEGNGQPTSGTNYCGGANADAKAGTRAKFYTGPGSAWNELAGTWGPEQYGYPLAFLIWDPLQAAESPSLPTPAGAPQRTCADMGSAGGGSSDRAQIHGLVYSGGHVQFNPMSLDGGVIAWEIQTQATSSNYTYNYNFGNAAPPPGFPKGGGTEVKIVRKSFIVCSNYSDESAAATACQ